MLVVNSHHQRKNHLKKVNWFVVKLFTEFYWNKDPYAFTDSENSHADVGGGPTRLSASSSSSSDSDSSSSSSSSSSSDSSDSESG